VSEDFLKVTLNPASAFDPLQEQQAGMLSGSATSSWFMALDLRFLKTKSSEANTLLRIVRK
jgi:hypothetical protein